MEKGYQILKKILLSMVTTIAVLMAVICFGNVQKASASHYTTIPRVLRGTWIKQLKRHEKQLIKMTKYTFYGANYKNGKKESNSSKLSVKKFISGTRDYQLVVSKHANKYGYWSIGLNDSDGVWTLKPIIHNGKRALKSLVPNIGHPIGQPDYLIGYYYRK